jgi:hypothetical protein
MIARICNPGFSLVRKEPPLTAAAAKVPRKRINRNGYIAEVWVSTSSIGEIYHYIVMREGSPEIVHWGQEVSMQRAVESVNQFIDDSLQMIV